MNKECPDGKTYSLMASEAPGDKERGCLQMLKLVLERDDDINSETRSERPATGDAAGAEGTEQKSKE